MRLFVNCSGFRTVRCVAACQGHANVLAINMLADTCKIHPSVWQLPMRANLFPVSCEKNAHAPTPATRGRHPPVPPHFNVAGEAPELANANVRFFRSLKWTPPVLTSTLKCGGEGRSRATPAWSMCVFFAGDGPWVEGLFPVKTGRRMAVSSLGSLWHVL